MIFIKKIKELLKKDKKIKIQSPLDNHFSVLASNGIKCDKNIIQGYFSMVKILSNNIQYFKRLETNTLCVFDPYNYDNIMTVKEFIDYTKEDNITYDNVIKSLEDNSFIANEDKDILKRGIYRLKESGSNINLEVLNYNLKNLKFIDESLDDSEYARFVADECCVYLDKKAFTDLPRIQGRMLYERIIIHEVLGHASNITYIPDNNGILCSAHFMALIFSNDRNFSYNIMGQSLDEAVAEYISIKSLHKKFNSEESPYLPFLYLLIILCKAVNITIEDYMMNGLEYLINKLKENSLEEGITSLQFLENKYANIVIGGYDYNKSLLLEDCFINILTKIIYINKRNGMSKEDNISCLESYIYSYNDYIIPFDNEIYIGVNEQTFQTFNFESLKNKALSFINDLYANTHKL